MDLVEPTNKTLYGEPLVAELENSMKENAELSEKVLKRRSNYPPSAKDIRCRFDDLMPGHDVWAFSLSVVRTRHVKWPNDALFATMWTPNGDPLDRECSSWGAPTS